MVSGRMLRDGGDRTVVIVTVEALVNGWLQLRWRKDVIHTAPCKELPLRTDKVQTRTVSFMLVELAILRAEHATAKIA